MTRPLCRITQANRKARFEQGAEECMDIIRARNGMALWMFPAREIEEEIERIREVHRKNGGYAK